MSARTGRVSAEQGACMPAEPDEPHRSGHRSDCVPYANDHTHAGAVRHHGDACRQFGGGSRMCRLNAGHRTVCAAWRPDARHWWAVVCAIDCRQSGMLWRGKRVSEHSITCLMMSIYWPFFLKVFDYDAQRSLLYNFETTFCGIYRQTYGVEMPTCAPVQKIMTSDDQIAL